MSRSLYARLTARYGPKDRGIDRRQFLQGSAAVGATLVIGAQPALLRADEPSTTKPAVAKPTRKIAVIGAGASGLACAYELMNMGYDVRVIEARPRVGGRMLTNRDDVVKGKFLEAGAELVGINHVKWMEYAKKFGLSFNDVVELEDNSAPIMFDGKLLDDETAGKLWEGMDEAFKKMDALAADIDADRPWLSPKAAELDKQTVQEWIDSLKLDELTAKAVQYQIATDNAVACNKQSLLCMLASVKGGIVKVADDKTTNYWDDSEIYRCAQGNDAVTTKLAEAIGKNRILVGLAVTKVEIDKSRVLITCSDKRTLEVDDVVLTVPPSVWGKIQFSPGLPPTLAPQMGVAMKYLSSVKTGYWNETKIGPDTLTDGPISQTWHGTQGQPDDGPQGLIGFCGGPGAEQVKAIKGKVDETLQAAMETLVPGYKDNVTAHRLIDWTTDPLTMAGYSFAAPGQVTSQGPTLYDGLHGRLHFAGEHTCYKYAGYMEGGLNSGASLASRIAKRDGVTA